MSKPLIIATAFAGCALVFLGVAAVMYTLASDDLGKADRLWSASEAARTRFIARTRELTASGYVETPKGAPEIPTILVKVATASGIDPDKQMRHSSLSSGSGGQSSRYSVQLDGVPLLTMGTFLGNMESQYPYLKVREIRALAISGKPSEFKWTLQVASTASKPRAPVGASSATAASDE